MSLLFRSTRSRSIEHWNKFVFNLIFLANIQKSQGKLVANSIRLPTRLMSCRKQICKLIPTGGISHNFNYSFETLSSIQDNEFSWNMLEWKYISISWFGKVNYYVPQKIRPEPHKTVKASGHIFEYRGWPLFSSDHRHSFDPLIESE